ncbi:MAG: DUF4870 domain-containing protein [Planctomycetes bacterium]|nr:DUF4870 domain-containing protein [Planctomycetota bacterium]
MRDEYGDFDGPEDGFGQPGSAEAKSNAMICHLASLAGYVIPFGNIIGPIIWWTMKKETDPFVDAHGRESVNFQISIMIWIACCVPLIFVVIGIVLIPILGLMDLVLTIVAALKAQNGETYRYPITIRFVK